MSGATDNNTIVFDDRVIVNASKIHPTVINAVGGTGIYIGEGALFSNNIEIHSTDYHGMYNKYGHRINYDKDIKIGKYVWVGLGSKILKGTIIADGSVVGAGSLVAGCFKEENVILAGNPAKVINRQIFWKHFRKDFCEVPDVLKEKWH